MQRRLRIGLGIVLAGLPVLGGMRSADAETVSLLSPTQLTADASGSGSDSTKVFDVSGFTLPLFNDVAGSLQATNTPKTASLTTTYDFSSEQFNFTFSQARNGNILTGATTYGDILFSVSSDTTYSFAGAFTTDGVNNAQPGSSDFEVWLYDGGLALFDQEESTDQTSDVAYTLGSPVTSNAVFKGNLTGTLLAGHTYKLHLGTQIEPDYLTADDGATASGFLSLGIGEPAWTGPSSAAAPLPPVTPAALGLLGALGLAQWLRRRKPTPQIL
jgi:hypothetical protein